MSAADAQQQDAQTEAALVKQIDYYFSRENIANDSYLVAQMDTDMWVPISKIVNFKKVSEITHDVDFIARAMAKSDQVLVDVNRMCIKPKWKLQRNTLILRDIASDTHVDIVRALFEPKFAITDVHNDVGDTWFVSFKDEDTAQDALFDVRNTQFRGQLVKARMKSEHLLKSTATTTTAAPAAPGAAQPAPYNPYYYGYQYNPYQQPVYTGGYEQQQGPDGRPLKPRGGGRNRTYPPPFASMPQEEQQLAADTQPKPRSPRPGSADSKQKGANARSGGRPRRNTDTKLHTAVVVPQMNVQHFPPLPGKPKSFKSGYDKEFVKYSKEDIIGIINKVVDLSRPEGFNPSESGVLLSAPNSNLEITKLSLSEPIVVGEDDSEQQAPLTPQQQWPVQRTMFVPKKTQNTEPAAQKSTPPQSTTEKSPTPGKEKGKKSRTNSPSVSVPSSNSTSSPTTTPTAAGAPSSATTTEDPKLAGVKKDAAAVAPPSPSASRAPTYADIIKNSPQNSPQISATPAQQQQSQQTVSLDDKSKDAAASK